VALAGFTPDDVAMTMEQNVLTLERRRTGTVRATNRAEADAPALGRACASGLSANFPRRKS
jgi:hypothetical protein